MMQLMKIDTATKLVNESILLRKANDNKIEEYAERMKAGVVFPPIIVGTWPKSEKYGEGGIVDGIHRVAAADKAGMKEIGVEQKKFNDLQEALTYMYTANMSHGLPPTEGQRNTRIKLLKQLDPKATVDTLAATFKLGRSSIDRILRDEQGEGRSGRKTGAQKRKEEKKPEPLKPKSFFTALDRIIFTLSRVRPTADIVAFASPEEEVNGKSQTVVDEGKREQIQDTLKLLNAILKELA